MSSRSNPAPTSSWRTVRNALLQQHYSGRDDQMAQIRPFLYLGSYGAAQNKAHLIQNNITHILCASPSLPFLFPSEFAYMRLEIADRADVALKTYLSSAIAYIQENEGGNILVHCLAGKSRSVAVVIAYLMRVESVSYAEAVSVVRAVRPQAAMNSGFRKQLALGRESDRDKVDE